MEAVILSKLYTGETTEDFDSFADSTGILRVRRDGSRIRVYYWRNGTWQNQIDQADGFTGNVSLRLDVDNYLSTGSIKWRWDNFIATNTEVVDTTGNGHNGIMNKTIWTSSGKVGDALAFDGVDDYIEISDDPDFDVTTITVAAWIYAKDGEDIPRGILSKDNLVASSEREMDMLFREDIANKIDFGFFNSSAEYNYLRSDSSLIFNKWHHVAATYNGSTINIYLNGVLDNTKNIVTDINLKSHPWRIGVQGYVLTRVFNGTIDDVTIWNRRLNSTEILRLYNLGASSVSSATNFTTSYGSTDFTTLANISAVPNMKLATAQASVRWINNVSAKDQDFDTNIKMGSGFISMNVSALDSSLNASANVSIEVNGCYFPKIYHSSTFYTTFNDIKSNGQECNPSTTPACTNIVCANNRLNFTVEHFDGYGGEGEEENVPELKDYALLFLITLLFGAFVVMNKRNK